MTATLTTRLLTDDAVRAAIIASVEPADPECVDCNTRVCYLTSYYRDDAGAYVVEMARMTTSRTDLAWRHARSESVSFVAASPIAVEAVLMLTKDREQGPNGWVERVEIPESAPIVGQIARHVFLAARDAV